MASHSFAESLNRGVLVFDGAMGTEIYRHHVFTNRCFDELCLSDPKLIRQIHTEYRDAGADVLTTNTFGANRVGAGEVRAGREAARDTSRRRRVGPRGSRCRGASDVRGRLDWPRPQSAAMPVAG